MSFLRASTRCFPGLTVGFGCVRSRLTRARCASCANAGAGVRGIGEFGVSIDSDEVCACIVDCVYCVIWLNGFVCVIWFSDFV